MYSIWLRSLMRVRSLWRFFLGISSCFWTRLAFPEASRLHVSLITSTGTAEKPSGWQKSRADSCRCGCRGDSLLYTVSPLALGFIQRRVGTAEDKLRICGRFCHGRAHAHRDEGWSKMCGDRLARDQLPDLIGSSNCRRQITAWYHQQEFLSAITADAVVFAQTGREARADLLQDEVSCLVPEPVIYLLEMIHVNQDNPHVGGVASRTGEFPLHESDDFTAIPSTSQEIMARCKMQGVVSGNELLLQRDDSHPHEEARFQLEWIKWFCQEVVYTRVHRFQHFMLPILGGQQDRIGVRFIVRSASKATAKLDAINLGKDPVEQGQPGRALLHQQFPCFLTVSCVLKVESPLLEVPLYQVPVNGGVFGQQD